MASQKAISGNTQKKNGSTILGGNAASTGTAAINDLSIIESAVRSKDTRPVVSAYQGNQKAKSSRTFAGMESSNFVIMGTQFNLGGESSTALLNAASVDRKGFNSVTSSRQSTLTGLSWSDSTDLPTYVFTKSDSTITYASDNSKNPRVTFLFGSINPTTSTI